eukprot:6000542-Pyramimonas_sp.AAC.1
MLIRSVVWSIIWPLPPGPTGPSRPPPIGPYVYIHIYMYESLVVFVIPFRQVSSGAPRASTARRGRAGVPGPRTCEVNFSSRGTVQILILGALVLSISPRVRIDPP